MKFNFDGIIHCNTEVTLENITQEQYTGITKFIDALSTARHSCISINKCELVDKPKMLNVGTRVWFIKRPEEIVRTSSRCGFARFKSEKLKMPMEMKIHQVTIDTDGIKYQVHGYHFTEGMIGKYVFLNYEDAVKNMNE